MSTQLTTPTTVLAPRQKAENFLTMYASLEAEILRLNALKAEVQEAKDEVKTQLLGWVLANPAEFGDNKTLALDGGTIGYKKEGERLVWDLDRTPDDYEVKLMKVVANDYPDALAPKVDMKQLLKAWCVLPNLKKKLGKLGLTTRNEDNFYIALKK